MAASSVISAARPTHRAARIEMGAPFPLALALDWNNAQLITNVGASNNQSAVFDSANDRIVMVSVGGASTVVGCWITVGTNPTASASVPGSMWIAQAEGPVPVYVPANQIIAVVQGATGGILSMVPALIASNP